MPRISKELLRKIRPITSYMINLGGRSTRNLQRQLSPITISDTDSNVEAENEVINLDEPITADDLTNPEGASCTYWRITAEKKQAALQEALRENQRLRNTIVTLRKAYEQYKQMLEEVSSFVEVFTEEFDNANDTGIDVNDVSTANETQGRSHETQGGSHETQGGSHEIQGGSHEIQGWSHESEVGSYETQVGSHETQNVTFEFDIYDPDSFDSYIYGSDTSMN